MRAARIDCKEKYFSLLDQVSKPGRYIGGEPNMIRKDLERVKVHFALAFPPYAVCSRYYEAARNEHTLAA